MCLHQGEKECGCVGVGGGGGRVKPLVKRIFHSFLNSLNCAHYIVNYLAIR